MKICVYCASSKGLDQKYLELGYEFGEKLAKRGHILVYGGYNKGIMGSLASGAAKNKGKIIAVVPEIFDSEDMIYSGCSEIIHTDTLNDRKTKMLGISDGFAVLPGGIGTYDEFFGTLCLKMLGRLDKPIGILNAFGYFDPMREMLEKNSREGFLEYGEFSENGYFTDAEELIEALEKNDQFHI